MFLLLLTTVAVLAAAGTEIDMTIADNSVSYNDAIFIQGPIDVNSAGTGVLGPFLHTGAGGGNPPITKGYNTVDASAEFDTDTGGNWTHPILLSGVPEVEINGVFYREFKLDINKAVGGNAYMAMNELKLFLTDDPAITGYDYDGGTEFGADATKVWDLGDAVVLMNYALESGSGASDVSFFVKTSKFSTTEDCSYGSSECTTYLVLWNEFGKYTDSALYPSRTWENNDGFEEWAVVLRPVVDVEKTAAGTYDERHDWDVLKSVHPESQSAFAGDSVSWDWTIDIFEMVTPGNYAASGTITIYNPTGSPQSPVIQKIPAEILSVDDVIDQAGLTTSATVTCPETFPYTLDGGETLICTYTATTPNADDGTNTAAITVEVPGQIGGGTDTYLAFADLAFTVNVINDYATVSDTEIGLTDVAVSGGDQFTGFDGDVCSTNATDYGEDGMYTEEVSNTATLTDEEGNTYESTATTMYTCYLWDVSKTANGSYNDQYGWDITKTVSPASQSGFAGDTLSWTWSISWSSYFVGEENYAVSGVITVTNPADKELTVDVSDYLTGPFAATVTCNDGDGGTDLTVAANSSGTCDYTAAPGSKLAQNTATATRNSVSVSDTVDVDWVKGADAGLDAMISDSNHADIPADSAQPYEYTDSSACSTDAGAYGEDGSYSGFADNTATITWTGGSDSDSAHTDYDCYLWDVSKTANGTYQDQYKWDITKTVDPESQSGFAGDTLSWTWAITWSSSFDKEINHAVSGVITVYNPADIPLTVNVADELTGNFAATVDCDGLGSTSLTIAAGGSGTCDYSAAPGSQLAQNTATATHNSVSVSDTVDVNWTKTGDVGLDATISDSNNETIPADSEQPYKYSDSHMCSTTAGDYGEDGIYSGSASNTATITWTGGSNSSTAKTSYDCYLWDVSKTANGTYNDRYAWDITKTVSPTSQSGFAGDTLEWEWTITWSSYKVGEENHAVSGVITVDNPADIALTVDVSDYLTGPFAATVTCNDGDGGTDLTIAANSSGTCDYTAAPDSQLAQNTATATRNGVSVSDTVNVNWTQNPDTGLDATITDTNGVSIPDDTSQPYKYTESVDCSTDTSLYVDGGVSYSGSADNNATITWDIDSDSDSASTSYTCYVPTISKTIEGMYDETHVWDIEKSVAPTSQSGFPGDTLEWTWTVNLSETIAYSNFKVKGVITLVNTNPDDELDVLVADVLSDGSAIGIIPNDATNCNLSIDGSDLHWKVPKGETGTCNYVSLKTWDSWADVPTWNKVSILLNNALIEYTASPIEWTPTVYGATANVDDDQESDFPTTVKAGDGPWTWTETQEHTCSTSWADYEADGTYSDTRYNTATVTGSNGQFDEASANTTYTCEAGTVNVLKLTQGVVDPLQDWKFELYVGPNSDNPWPFSDLLASDSSLGKSDGVLDFGMPALRPDTTYTFCELNAPAGWASMWSYDSTPITPYNPDRFPTSGFPNGQDLGRRCFDFGAGTAYPISTGDTLSFTVDNRFPGGEPRTIGFWKNWATCTGGGQAITATKNAGYDGDPTDPEASAARIAAGYFLLDDVLNPPGITLGSYIIPASDATDSAVVKGKTITKTGCEIAVSILDKSDWPTDKKKAADAAYGLAAQLLAAKANITAGAKNCPALSDAVLAADALLTDIDFDGTGDYLGPKVKGPDQALRNQAIDLANTLDLYNNGLLCP